MFNIQYAISLENFIEELMGMIRDKNHKIEKLEEIIKELESKVSTEQKK